MSSRSLGAASANVVVAYAGQGRTRLETRETPTPAKGEVLLALRACGLCGTDLFKLANDSVEAGTVLGHELVGEVLAVGEGAGDWTPGERVVVPHHVACGTCRLCRAGSDTLCAVFRENLLSPGGFAERVLVRSRAVEQALYRVPETVTDEAAVFLEPAACVLRGLQRSGILQVDPSAPRVAVVVGGGSMGLLHLLVLRARCPGVRVLVVDPQPGRRALALELGADCAVTPAAVGSRDEADAALRELSPDGLGADAVFDTVGGAAILCDAIRRTRPGGTVVLFAHARSGESADFDLNSLFKEERRVVATYSGGLTEQRETWDLIREGRLDASPLVTARLTLGRFDEAVERVRALDDLKVLLVPEASAPKEDPPCS